MALPLALLADDLTGALEAAAACTALGRVAVPLGNWPAADLLVVDTATRELPAAAAAAGVQASLRQLRAAGRQLVYKKIDSTLRGPVAAELASLTRADPALRLVVCPANPPAGRAYRGGCCKLPDGSCHNLATVLPGVPHLSLRLVRSPRLPALLAAMPPGPITVDAVTTRDLDLLAAAVLTTPDVLPVGSGGLIAALARQRWGVAPELAQTRPFGGSAMLFACGSAHPANVTQAGTLVHRARAEASLEPSWALPQVVRLELPAAGQPLNADRLAELAAAVQRQHEREPITHLFVTGGATAAAVLRALAVDWLRVLGSLAPGVVAALAQPAGPLVVTKPGGFGDSDTWLRVWRWWRGT
ncbi:MAG: hypothetical protein IT204_20125 [Fimbriimonadaceae bacterium]|nr:hypothetical protein [Fimbriimonadaceae bacterium]